MSDRNTTLDEAIAVIRERAKAMSSGGFTSKSVTNATIAYIKDLEKLKTGDRDERANDVP